jgi:response regulator RpfG family c-di-GMP phosphodiesterase
MFDTPPTEKKVLIIQDDHERGKLLSGYLSKRFLTALVSTTESALEEVRRVEFDVVLCDVTSPAIDGVFFMPRLQIISPRSVLIIIGEKDSSEEAIRAFRAGAFDFIPKPFDLKQIEAAVSRAAEHFELKLIKEKYQFHLEELVSQRMIEIDRALEEVESSYRTTLKALVQALETRDFETHGHSERVVTFSLRLGHEIGLTKDELRNLELGALLHDIGKIGVPDAILRKPAKLTEDEWEKMKLHPIHGKKILRNIPFLEGAARVVAQHHEKWDGSGYPKALRGEDIDIGARIFAVVDAFDAMVSDRVYRKGRPYIEALEELERCAGSHFDPIIVEAFKNIPQEDWEILRERSVEEREEPLSFQAVVTELVFMRQQMELVH